MSEQETQSVQAAGDDSQGRRAWRAAALSAVVGAEGVALALIALYPPVSVAAVALFTVCIALAGTLLLSKVTEARWFPRAAAWTLTAVLLVCGLVAEAAGRTPARPAPAAMRAPVLQFVQNSPATVPWCTYFDLTVAGTIPDGYKILVFDASTNPADTAIITGHYSYDAVARPVSRVPGEWVAGPVFVSSPYVQNGNGLNLYKNGKPVSNAGYTVKIFALILPANNVGILDEFGHAAWNMSELPGSALATATLDVIRNGDVRNCVSPGT
jgi:hypothetical protein